MQEKSKIVEHGWEKWQFCLLSCLFRNRKISGRIKSPPSQFAGIEMAVGIFIIV